jgi:hypothetical protein
LRQWGILRKSKALLRKLINKNKRRKGQCHEVTAKAPLEGAAEERAGAEDKEWDLEEGEWVVPGRAPARQGSVCARNAALQPPTKLESLATRYSALSVVHPWSENKDRLTQHNRGFLEIRYA